MLAAPAPRRRDESMPAVGLPPASCRIADCPQHVSGDGFPVRPQTPGPFAPRSPSPAAESKALAASALRPPPIVIPYELWHTLYGNAIGNPTIALRF